MADEDLKAELERLKAENERLKTQRGRSVSLKVSEKGGVSVYGLGRFPVTLYKEQWTKLLAMTDEIRAFIKEHDAELKDKPEAQWGIARHGERIFRDASIVPSLVRESQVVQIRGLQKVQRVSVRVTNAELSSS